MVQETISNAILIIAVVVATAVVLNAVYPAVSNAVGSLRSAADSAGSRAETAVTITASSFSADYCRLTVWMKNTGKDDIAGAGQIRAYYGNDSGPLKNYAIQESRIVQAGDGQTAWGPGETLEIGIVDSLGLPLPHEPGLHRIRVVLPDGATGESTIVI